MTRRQSVFITLLIILCCIPVVGSATEKKKSKTKSSAVKIESENPFDTTAQTFSVKSRNKEANLYLALTSKVADYTKGEYETTEDFEARMSKICDKTIAGNLKYCDSVGFLTQYDIKYSYDADEKKLVVGVPLKGEAFDTNYVKTGSKKYVGTNAFGAKAKITSSEFLTLAVSMRRDEPKPEPEGNDRPRRMMKPAMYAGVFYRQARTLTLNVPMSPDEAKDMKNNGGIVIIGKLYKPYTDKYLSHSKPTITEPTEVIDDIRYVVIDPSEIWVVNTKTGKIFSREKVDLEISDYSRNQFITKPIQ